MCDLICLELCIFPQLKLDWKNKTAFKGRRQGTRSSSCGKAFR